MLIDRLDRLLRAGELSDGLNPAQWDAMRYLGRANRFSRTPAALADFLASTRGTVSQTLIALESKGFVIRSSSVRDGRSVDLALSELGRAIQQRDPLLVLASNIESALGTKASELAAALASVLHQAIVRRGGRAFGVCSTCRHFQKDHSSRAAGRHYCGLLQEPLSEDDSQEICAEQELAAASSSAAL